MEGHFPKSVDIGIPESAPPPEPPPSGAGVWLRENLFSTPLNGLLSLVTGAILLGIVNAVVSWALEPTRIWRAVAANSQLLMVQAYPDEKMWRVWTSLGLVLVLTGLSLAVWRAGGKRSWQSLSQTFQIASTATGIVSVFAIINLLNTDRTPRLTIVLLVLSVALFFGVRSYVGSLGEAAKEENVSTFAVLGLVMVVGLVVMWFLQAPVTAEVDGLRTDDWQPIANSTKIPWTIMAALLAGSYAFGVQVRDRWSWLPRVLVIEWVLSAPFIVMVMLRAPDIVWSSVFARDLPVFLGFSIVGAALIMWAAKPDSGEVARIVSAVIFIGGAISIFLVDALMVIKFSVVALGVFLLMAPTFGGSPAVRKKYAGGWVAAMFLIVFAFRMGASASAYGFRGGDFLGGLTLTFTLAIFAVALSFPLGVALALGRTSTLPIIRTLSTGYIELVRSVPLITWLFAGANLFQFFVPGDLELDGIVRAIIAITLFSAAYTAENVRGGLQSISKGQYEAADALGMSVVQKIFLIVLPQAIKAIIPTLVGSTIALFKDTSLVAIIGLFDLLLIAKNVIPNQQAYAGSFMEAIVAIAVIYWLFTITFSRASLRLEQRLGLGTR